MINNETHQPVEQCKIDTILSSLRDLISEFNNEVDSNYRIISRISNFDLKIEPHNENLYIDKIAEFEDVLFKLRFCLDILKQVNKKGQSIV